MKNIRLFLLILLVLPVFKASSQSSFLLPEKFYMQKGEALDLRLLQSEDFVKETDLKYEAVKTGSFSLYQGKKIIDLTKSAKDADSIISCQPVEDGLAMVEMTLKTASNDMSRNKFLRSLNDDDPNQMTDKVKNSNQLYFKEKFTTYMKTLVQFEKPSGKIFEKGINQDYEIIVQENPYKLNYGDDISALINFKGKPLVNATVFLYVKTVGGNVFPQKMSSDASGLVYFKLSREGVYILRTKHIEASKDKTADFESWRATYTFAFSSSNELPNTYREFGFGDKH